MTRNQPDRLDRLESALTRFAETTMDNLVRHDAALLRLEESAARHNDVLSRLEESATRHDETLSRLEVSVTRHDEALNRIEGAIADLTTQMDQLGERVNVLAVTSTETIRLVADNSRAIAASNEKIARSEERIEQILEYLFRERPNGRDS